MSAGDRYFGPFGVSGEEVGTGALINVRLDFKPMSIEICNRTQNSTYFWMASMPQDSASKRIAAGTQTFITSNGINSGNAGFSIGTDATLNAASDVIYWTAHRSMKF